jgi:hypothetical protein
MIRTSTDFDLGHDRTRIKEIRDAKRQTVTTTEILRRFFNDQHDERIPIQVLADEVGMGKTFVALATAFSVLQAMRRNVTDEDLRGCYQRVLIVTPSNEALYAKWQNETGEFVKRCVVRDQEDARQWFAPVAVRRIDELSEELRKPGTGPRVLVTTMGMFQGAKIRHYDVKRRFLLGLLFRYWGTRFRYNHRINLLKGAPGGWPTNPDHLTDLDDREREVLPFGEEEALGVLGRIDRQTQHERNGRTPVVEELLNLCREIAEPYRRNRDDDFRGVEWRLADLYKAIAARLILKDFPLVIVDEAHNWKNGPSQGSNGYWYFYNFIAPHARRLLMLTATPFQLRPEEMIEILRVSDGLAPAPLQDASAAARDRVAKYRDDVILPTLKRAEAASRMFTRLWGKLPPYVTTQMLTDAWIGADLVRARKLLLREATHDGKMRSERLLNIVEKAQKSLAPEMRPFCRTALELFAYNADLSHELHRYVIRHRRRTEHRLFRAGEEFRAELATVLRRPDAHVLHGAPGIDVQGVGELPHYILMRCVSEMKRLRGRHGRSSLGSALTGCYSTLLHSAEGRSVKTLLAGSPLARQYLDLLMALVAKDEDSRHPKVVPAVDYAVDNWRRGEKTLFFCFRVNTADRLEQIISDRIAEELKSRARSCLGGEDKLKALKGRLQGKERDLIVIGLDRVLWALVWGCDSFGDTTVDESSLDLSDGDLEALARLSLVYDIPLTGERVDRVFLNRATEHVIAKRMLDASIDGTVRQVLDAMASSAWIEFPYGLESTSVDTAEGERAEFDERGAHSVYRSRKEPSSDEMRNTHRLLVETRTKARRTGQIPILDVYAKGPNLLLGVDPASVFGGKPTSGEPVDLLKEIHRRLWSLSLEPDGTLSWESRRKVMQAIRRAVLRESILVRLLPQQAELEEAMWGQLLVSSFFRPLVGQRESLASRIAVFLEDLDAAGGDLAATEPELKGTRYAIYDSTRLTDQFVALIKGGGGGKSNEHRTRVFTGFNTPLLPEVLICTQVGQEGIDLHRHCRHVIHYDLAWNPAVLEQRTGRADRIGSKTFRERELYPEGHKPRLEVGVPFLAGTYDERMFEELRLRSQTFEVLTGGDFAADNPEGEDNRRDAEGTEAGMKLAPLPAEMLQELRVRLNVYPDDGIAADRRQNTGGASLDI